MDNNSMSTSGMERICKRCLTRDLAEKSPEYANLQNYIENLDRDIKVKNEIYEKRLEVCVDCEFFIQGMCRSCGCYVELRAAIGKNQCPHKKWLAC